MASSYSMSREQKEFLRKNREYLKEHLSVDHVWPHMTSVLNKNDEDLIIAETTRPAKVIKLIDLLPLRGSDAFDAFIIATYKVQKWLGKDLADKAGIKLDAILPSAEVNPGMEEVHHKILRSNLPLFNETLDVKRMVKSLSKAEIITVENPGLAQAVLEVREEQTKQKQVEKLICEVLPQLGPNAFNAFITILQHNQPHFAHEFRQSIKQSHPDVLWENKCYPETSNVAIAADQKYSLLTPCSELPENVFKLSEECLNKPNEVLENDWKKFYKVLKLPEGRENVIAGNPNPTRFVMNSWIARDGKHATVKKFLEALMECEQGGLAHSIEQMLGVELKLDTTVVDGVANMRVGEPKKKKAIRIAKDIPRDLKLQFINRLNGLKQGVLSDVASAVKGERCYIRDADDFLEKIGEQKTRILFRELRKENQSEITKWMRDTFPAGSTGPVKSADEQKACDMNYGRRCEITKILTANGSWESLVSHPDIDMKAIDIALLKKSGKDPSESVLSRWEVSTRSTVGTMYDLLVDCGLPDVADHL